MRVIFGVFSLLPFLIWLLQRNKYDDQMNPVNLFTLLYTFNIAIPCLLYANEATASAISTSYIKEAVMNEGVFAEYVILQTIGYFLVLFGMRLRIGSEVHCEYLETCYDEYDPSSNMKYRIIGVTLWIIGLFAFFMIMRQVGGVAYFFTHLQYRASMIRHIDFWTWLLPMLNHGTLFIVYSYKGTEKSINIWIILLIIASGFMSGLGGRKDLILLFIKCLIIYHYAVKPIEFKKLFRLKYLVLILGVYLFFILMKSFRTAGAIELFLSNPITFINENNNGILNTIRGESYVSSYMSVIKYFRTNDFWYGKSFLGLITAIIPSSMFPAKPPVDDGAYLYSIVQGRTDIIPPMPFSQLNGSSLPLETFGSMYANFGAFGVMIGMIVLGGIYSKAYRMMKAKSYSLFTVVMYTQLLFTFELSTLRIFQTFELVVVLWGVTFIVEHINTRRN